MAKLILDDGRELTVTVTEEELKKLEEKQEKKFDAFDVKKGEKHYWMNYSNEILESSAVKEEDVKNGLTCKDKSIIERRAMRQILNNRLEKYAYEHGVLASAEDLRGYDKHVYTVIHGDDEKGWSHCIDSYYHNPASVYFTDDDICERSINEVVFPFCEEYPDFV